MSNVKFARCMKCKNYYLVTKLHRADCNSCEYRTYRCDSKECNGAAGAMRSILAHFHWWRSRGDGEGGHDRRALLDSLKGISRRLHISKLKAVA